MFFIKGSKIFFKNQKKNQTKSVMLVSQFCYLRTLVFDQSSQVNPNKKGNIKHFKQNKKGLCQ